MTMMTKVRRKWLKVIMRGGGGRVLGVMSRRLVVVGMLLVGMLLAVRRLQEDRCRHTAAAR